MDMNESTKHAIFELGVRIFSQHEQSMARIKDQILLEIEDSKMNVNNLNLTDIHVIACIGSYEPINVTSIVEKIGVSKASISKIGVKLHKMKLIRRTQLNDNKKEVYFLLTAEGHRLHKLHERIHNDIEASIVRFLSAYTPEQLLFVKGLLQDALNFTTMLNPAEK
jgi:DNA-binding MarR family transcriptional regulator